MTNNIWHLLPVNDINPHLEDGGFVGNKIVVNGEIRDEAFCNCKCNPKIKYEEYEAVLIIHNSFDGREGVEWANEILNKK